MNKAANGQPLLNHFMIINRAAVEGKCEDSYAYSFGDTYGMLGVFDGCGGLGARKYDAYHKHTGAYIASRITGGVVLDWFEGDMPCDQTGMYSSEKRICEGLKTRIDKALDTAKNHLEAGVRTGGMMVKPFPTTLNVAVMDWSNYDRVRCLFLWAGDSRSFVLDPNGLVQCTKDDLRIDGDAFDNLYSDSPLSNVVSGDGDYHINAVRFPATVPAIVISATDGTFGYWPSPMHYEWMFVNTLMCASSFEDWEARLNGELEAVAADDATLAMGVFGWHSFDEMRAAFAPRYEYLRVGLENAQTEEELRIFWDEYRRTYYREAAAAR
ncbi:MAG: hypothetical protein IJC56_09540 [Clostridia bacterium]|nr:hypothetical protein [Clostridia bacterium]